METIITELSPRGTFEQNEELPMFTYFYYTNYKSESDFINLMDKKEKYPLINQLLINMPDFKKLKYLPIFNEFTNMMLKNYSFKISRDEAKN